MESGDVLGWSYIFSTLLILNFILKRVTPIIVVIIGVNYSLRTQKWKTRLIANAVMLLGIIIFIVVNVRQASAGELLQAVKNDDINQVYYILKSGKANINAQDTGGETALIRDVRYGNLEITKYLIESGADVNIKSKDYGTALIWASIRGYLEIVDLLIKNGANVNDINDKSGTTALIGASREGDWETVKILIENGADVNIKNSDGETALDMAQTEEVREVLIKSES